MDTRRDDPDAALAAAGSHGAGGVGGAGIAGGDLATQARALVVAVRAAADRIADTRDAVLDVGASGAQVGTAVRVIASIAAQTNLLALNAAITAVGHGDPSMPVDPVAGEVKHLAQQAADVTGEVEQRIGDIQVGTAGAVAGIAALETALDLIDQLARRIDEMVTAGRR